MKLILFFVLLISFSACEPVPGVEPAIADSQPDSLFIIPPSSSQDTVDMTTDLGYGDPFE